MVVGCEERKKRIAWRRGKNGVAISREKHVEGGEGAGSAMLVLRCLLDMEQGGLAGGEGRAVGWAPHGGAVPTTGNQRGRLTRSCQGDKMRNERDVTPSIQG